MRFTLPYILSMNSAVDKSMEISGVHTINPRECIKQKELYSLKLTPWRLVSAVPSLISRGESWLDDRVKQLARRGHYGSVYVCVCDTQSSTVPIHS